MTGTEAEATRQMRSDRTAGFQRAWHLDLHELIEAAGKRRANSP